MCAFVLLPSYMYLIKGIVLEPYVEFPGGGYIALYAITLPHYIRVPAIVIASQWHQTHICKFAAGLATAAAWIGFGVAHVHERSKFGRYV